jgi:hypothetical protein
MLENIVLPRSSESSESSTQYTNITISNDIESNIPNLLQLVNPVNPVNPVQSKSTTSQKCKCLLEILSLFCCIALAVTYTVYVIISLCQTSYDEQKEMCKNSNIWLYLLLNIICNSLITSSTVNSKLNSNSKNKNNSNYSNLIQVLYVLSFTIWGCIELFGVNCVDNIKSTLLYTMMEVSVFIRLIILGLLLIISFVLCCIKCCFIRQINLN